MVAENGCDTLLLLRAFAFERFEHVGLIFRQLDANRLPGREFVFDEVRILRYFRGPFPRRFALVIEKFEMRGLAGRSRRSGNRQWLSGDVERRLRERPNF